MNEMIDQRVKPDRRGVQKEAMRYLRAKDVLRDLRRAYRSKAITPQEYSTMRGQAVNGDVEGAVKGLARLCGRDGR